MGCSFLLIRLYRLIHQHSLALISVLGTPQDLETEYLEKKTIYDNTKAGLESNFAKLQLEADAAEKECAHEESNACYYESMIKIEQVTLDTGGNLS